MVSTILSEEFRDRGIYFNEKNKPHNLQFQIKKKFKNV